MRAGGRERDACYIRVGRGMRRRVGNCDAARVFPWKIPQRNGFGSIFYTEMEGPAAARGIDVEG